MGHQRKVPDLNDRIRELVHESGLSIRSVEKELTQSSQSSRNLLCSWLYYDSNPSAYWLKRICEYFNVSADWLLGLSDRKEPR
jgi:transcriptional regulator with XRE-family HTH domain